MGQEEASWCPGSSKAAVALRDGHPSVSPSDNLDNDMLCEFVLGVDDPDDRSDTGEARASVFEDSRSGEEEIAPPDGDEPGQEHASSEEEDVEKPRIMRSPKQPRQAEREEHETTHMPARDWCPDCLRGRGISDQHGRHPLHPM